MAASLHVIYDGQCGLCTNSVAVLRRLDWLGRLAYLDATDLERVRKAFPTLPTENLLHEIHIVNPNGRYWTAYRGFQRLALTLPPLWLLAPFLYLPGVSWAGNRIYHWVAANRARNLCETDICLEKRRLP